MAFALTVIFVVIISRVDFCVLYVLDFISGIISQVSGCQ